MTLEWYRDHGDDMQKLAPGYCVFPSKDIPGKWCCVVDDLIINRFDTEEEAKAVAVALYRLNK